MGLGASAELPAGGDEGFHLHGVSLPWARAWSAERGFLIGV